MSNIMRTTKTLFIVYLLQSLNNLIYKERNDKIVFKLQSYYIKLTANTIFISLLSLLSVFVYYLLWVCDKMCDAT